VSRIAAAAALLPVLACIWDSDTLSTEVRGIPGSEALVVTDRWPRHGRAYYEKRIREIPSAIERDPLDLGLYDDIAVALERLERREEALAWMERKAEALKQKPDPEHEYRRLANRGTFLAHAGRYEEGLRDIEAAVALNPAAHFGRESFQVDAMRFVIAAKADPSLWGRETFLSHAGWDYGCFFAAHGIDPARGGKAIPSTRTLDWREAHEAVAGILRFGGLEGAEFYRVLGELYSSRLSGSPGQGLGNLHLAWWSFRRAIDRGHPAADKLRAALGRIEHHWSGAGFGRVPNESIFLAMKAWGKRWQEAFQAAEEAAIGRGEDVRSEAAIAALTGRADAEVGAPPPAFDDSIAAHAREWTGGRESTAGFLLKAAAVLILGAFALRFAHRAALRKRAAAS
jgi:tetratricopeptide (TPR) repeat protein